MGETVKEGGGGNSHGLNGRERMGTDGNGFFGEETAGGRLSQRAQRREGDFFLGKSFWEDRFRRFVDAGFVSFGVQARKEAKPAKIFGGGFFRGERRNSHAEAQRTRERIRFNRMDKDGERRIRMGWKKCGGGDSLPAALCEAKLAGPPPPLSRGTVIFF